MKEPETIEDNCSTILIAIATVQLFDQTRFSWKVFLVPNQLQHETHIPS